MSYMLTATRETLAYRAQLLAHVRAFFAERGVLEVETPALSTSGVSDPAIESLTASAPGYGLRALYLRTSPEHALKRLLAAGSGDVFELGRVFRDGEAGRWHAPEFTMLEWYRVGWDERSLAEETAELIGELFALRGERPPVARTTYREAVERALGVPSDAPIATLEAALDDAGVAPPRGLDRDALLDLALSTLAAPRLAAGTLTIVHDFPASQAALAEIRPGNPPVAARFEIFFEGLELANGYRELTDASEQRARFEADLARRRDTGRPTPPLDEAFLEAVADLPPSAGVSVGIDRVLALTLGLDNLSEALTFTHDRP